MSTICKTCGQHKQEVRCPDCRGIRGFFRSSCERCNSTKYILECPDQKNHDFVERIERMKRYHDRYRGPIKITTSNVAPRPTQPPAFCWKCSNTGFITEMVEVPNILTPWPPFNSEERTVPCPECNRGY